MTDRIKKSFAHTKKHPVFRNLALLFAAFLVIKLAVSLGFETRTEEVLKSIANSDHVTDILDMELIRRYPVTPDAVEVLASQSALFGKTAVIEPPEDVPQPAPETPDNQIVSNPITVKQPEPQPPTPLFYEYSIDPEQIRIKNKTKYEIDPKAVLDDDLNIHIDPSSPQVLIIHTHGSEAYFPDGDDIYTASDPSRTEDKNYNVVRVGDRLTELLEARGISVLHDRSLYDYPSYTGSYTRSMESIESYLSQYPDIKVVIDLHRDALEESDGTIHRTAAEIGGETCSQILLIVGSNYSGLEHPNWKENLRFALHLQADMDEKYPGLTRPVTISQYRYNQQATTGSLIVEVGCTGNTLQESLLAAEHFSDCMADVLLRYSEG